MTGRTQARTPWRDADIVMVAITGLLGLIAIAAAWFAASHAAGLAARGMWLNMAVAGFAVSATGLALWLMRGRRAVGERRMSLVSLEPVAPAEPEPAARPVGSGDTGTVRVVRIPGTRHAHDRGCPLVAGKRVEPATLADGAPCGVCMP